jgi:hypothetical protein
LRDQAISLESGYKVHGPGECGPGFDSSSVNCAQNDRTSVSIQATRIEHNGLHSPELCHTVLAKT